MITLRSNSHAPEVRLLQRLLNHRYSTDSTVPNLVVDGNFGPRTEALLRRFQTGYTGPGRLTVDGIAGDSTWRALGLATDVAWPVPQVGQNTTMSCWVVSGGMASGRMASMVPPTATFDPVEASYADGRDGGGLGSDSPNLNAYAAGLGMRSLDGSPLHINGVLEHLRRGPAILIGNWSNGGSHAVVVSAVYIGPTATTSRVRINNPSPIGRGSIQLSPYPAMNLEGQNFTPDVLIVK
jgi:hypothetical protein